MTSTFPDVGDPCPDFDLPTAGGGTASLSDYAGGWLVLYFYPRADTPGCTVQAVDFGKAGDRLAALGARVLGVSKDPVAKLDKFVAKRDLSVTLASDADSDLCERAGVWVEKSMYGKTYMGLQRATLIVGPDGRVAHTFPKVRAKGHADAVLDWLETNSA